MKRKLLSLILVVAMLASMAIFVPAASASDAVVATVETTNAAGVAGDEVTVDLNLTVDQTTGFQLAFTYDTSRLNYEGITYVAKDMGGDAAGAPQNQQFVNYGPYNMIQAAFVTADNKTLSLDCSETLAVATLTFTIKEDAPAGDAYVEFCSLNGVYNDAAYRYDKIVRSTELGIADDILYEGSVVTVLPEGYETLPVVADDAWVFENGVISGCTDASLATYTGLFVFPSEINGEAVTTIAARAFEEYAWSSIVIPASVTLVKEGAIHTCANLTKVYVLNPETVLEPMSIGWDITYKDTGAINNKKTFVTTNDNDDVITSFYGVAGSTAQVYAETGDEEEYFFSFYAELPPYTVSFGGATYSVPATVKLPGTAVIDGKTVVAWKDGDKTFAAGATVTLTESLVLEPVTITAPVTSTEVDFKLAAKEADLAMRFTATLSKADYATLASLGTVKLGMLITPAKYVSLAGSFTKEALDDIGATNGAYVDVAIDGYYKETADDYILAGSLKGFSAKTLAKNPDFASVVYATVTTAEGDVFTVYGDFNHAANQNVKTVAEAIVATNITNTQKGWLNTLIGKFGA